MAMSVKTMNVAQCSWHVDTNALEKSAASYFKAEGWRNKLLLRNNGNHLPHYMVFTSQKSRTFILSKVFLRILSSLADTEHTFRGPY
jgi:hypothetical protein